MRNIALSISLLIILLSQNSMGHVTAMSASRVPSNVEPRENITVPSMATLAVNLSTATGKTIVFKAEDPKTEVNLQAPDHEIPHLVLNRNGVPTPGFERTLQVKVDNLSVPPSGMYVQLIIETQHGDPDLERERNVRIRVWKEMSFVPYNAFTYKGVNVSFKVTFDPITELLHKKIKTPTDYYRLRILITNTQGNPLQTYVEDFAFLMENQWRLPLPAVLEAIPGSAPDELLVYYYDMMPFQPDLRDPDSRIPREEVDRYIQTELVPAMVEAFQMQSNVWGFPWYEEWRNFRREENPKTLSVALGEHQTWYHGKPASLGHSMISIRVDGTTGEYDNLTDGLISTFHHELFHNHQRNISLHFNGNAAVAGKDQAWMMFSEGTAVLASSVGQPDVHFEPAARPRSYLRRANAFLGSAGAVDGGGLNKSYNEIPYQTALYWRFLYENCGGINPEGEDPSTGMQVIHHILETLYKGEVVDINSSTDTAMAFPLIIDRALQATPSCGFTSYEKSLIHFARAIYFLRLEEGRCSNATNLASCGFMDPHHVYQTPAADAYVVSNTGMEVEGAIPSSYGIDLIELELDPSVKGETLQLEFDSLAEPHLEFHVELWKTKVNHESNEPEHGSPIPDKPVSVATENGSLVIEMPTVNSADFNGLGLIITRIDPHEKTEPTGAYSIKLLAK